MTTQLTEADATWIARERERYYQRPPVWLREQFWTDRPYATFDHYPHISETDPTLLAYTPSLEYGRADRQVRLKPGRYLTKYFGDVLSQKQIQFYAQWWATGARPADEAFARAQLAFATTEDEIATVYREGPHSCMAEQFEHAYHPCRVYAAGDLAIAYLEIPDPEGDDARIIARALVWPERKVVGRVYPSDQNWRRDGFDSPAQCDSARDLLFNKLKAEGFKHISEGATFNGARLLKIESDCGSYLMPYLDSDYGVNDRGEYWRMSDDGYDHSCQETEGVLEPESRTMCERCEDMVCDDETYTVYTRWSGRYARGEVNYCSYCYENRTFRCDGCEESFSDDCDAIAAADGNTYLLAWAEQNGFYQSDRSGDWFDGDNDPAFTTRNGDVIAESEIEPGDREDEDEDEDEDADGDDAPAPIPAASPTIEDARQVEFAL